MKNARIKKIDIRYLLILIFICEVILIITLINKHFFKVNTSLTTLKDIKYLTMYHDFSELNVLPADYSLSTILYTQNTQLIPIGNTQLVDFDEDAYGNRSYYDHFKAIWIRSNVNPNDNPRVRITNCAFDNEGRSLDVIVGLSEFRKYDNNADSSVNLAIGLPGYRYSLETNQKHPIHSNEIEIKGTTYPRNPYTTAAFTYMNWGEPILFNLNTSGAQVKFTLTYYYSNTNTRVDIKRACGFYTDIDIVYYKEKKGKSTIFSGGKKSRNEGIRPVDTSSNTAIYYNKFRTAKIYDNKRNSPFRIVKLAEDNGGIKIDSYTNEKGVTTDKDRSVATKHDPDSFWYGDSAFMINNLQNGEMSFYYGGDLCGIVYCFMSPVPYEIPSPFKQVDKDKITKGDKLTYSVKQYIPNLLGQTSFNFQQVYGSQSGYAKCGNISQFILSDNINNNYDISDVRVFRNDQDVTGNFGIYRSGNYVQATSNTNDIHFLSNAFFSLKITCKLKSTGVNVDKISNTGQTVIKIGGETFNRNTKNVDVSVYYKLKGNVWIENNGINGKKDGYDFNYNGMIVQLLDSYGNVIRSTKTNANGIYEFSDELPGNRKYYIRFNYNGQIYQDTYYKSNISKGTSSGLENDQQRVDLQNRFATIRGSPNNYLRSNNQWNVAFGIYQKIVNLDDNSLYYINNRPLLMIDILREIDNMNTNRNDSSIDGILWNIFHIYNYKTRNAIINYINDCMLTAQTKEISINDIIDLGDGNCVDFGVYTRPLTDLAISNDLVSTTYIINGKISNQYFNEKSKQWNADTRAQDSLYNGKKVYELPIKSADYLFNAEDYGEDNIKNLKVYVKYKITIKNNGQTCSKVDYINNWFDNNKYTFNADEICQDNTYIQYSNKQRRIKLTQNGTMMANLKQVIITGENNTIQEDGDYLAPGDEAYIYLTFKVNNDSNGKLMIEQGKNSTSSTIGKRNVCEIAQYETFYKRGINNIPDYMDSYGNLINKNFSDGMAQGTIDVNSNPGSLRDNDFTASRSLNYDTKRIENDTDQSPELKIKINNATSKISGTVFEDKRKVNTVGNAVIGDGLLDDKETKINGVTVELVELVRAVDDKGIPSVENVDEKTGEKTGYYVGEKIWGSYTYDANGKIVQDAKSSNTDYYSGMGNSKIILNSDDDRFKVLDTKLSDGQYMFDNIPSGDFVVRFKYGDTYRTVLTNNADNEVNKLLKAQGLNEKSYNGHDYKSTIYEKSTNKIDYKYSDTDFANKDYKGIINNYSDTQDFYNNKNYINNKDDYEKYQSNLAEYMRNVQDKINFYDFNNISDNDSDAKDVLYYRMRGNEFSKDLTNYKGEILDSFEKKVQCKTNESERQKDSVNALIANTFMVAQTGVIDTLNNDDGNINKTSSVNFGLVERPKAQIVLNQNVSNIKIILANGQILFNADKNVRNLYFGENRYNDVILDTNRNLLNGDNVNTSKQAEKPSLIQATIDDELMIGANIEIAYKITAENKSEVDFNDNVFYYTGVENNPKDNLSKLEISEIVDYVPNSLSFDIKDDGNGNLSDATSDKNKRNWKVTTTRELINANDHMKSKVNNIYIDTLETYNTLLVSEFGTGQQLIPKIVNDSGISNEQSKIEFYLKLKNMMSMEMWTKNNLTYNNLMEIVHIKSDTGRRMAYSILGNQEMANQAIGTISDSIQPSGEDYIQVKEIDAASSQKVVALPPTGRNKGYYNFIIIVLLVNLIIIIIGVWQITIHVIKDN